MSTIKIDHCVGRPGSCSAAHHVLHRPLRFSVLQQVSDNSRASKTILFTLPVQFDIELRLVPVSAPAGPVCIVRRLHSVQFSGLQRGILLLSPAAPATPGHRLPRLLRLHSVQFSGLQQTRNSPTTVQSYSWDCNVPDQLHAPLPIVQFAGFHNCFQQLLSSKTIVKCFALLGEYSPMENYK